MKKVLLVDGYNVIRAGRLYEHLSERSPDHASDTFNAAREALLSDVASFAGREYQATVVFDGAGNPGSAGERQSFGTIGYLFSPHGVSADSVIERLANHAAQEGREVLVVTSDATLQSTVFGHKVTRMSALGFSREIELLREDLDELSSPGKTIAQKNTLADRLDPDTAEKLRRLLR
jgi:predicted RNA-binding protein with PIN domain